MGFKLSEHKTLRFRKSILDNADEISIVLDEQSFNSFRTLESRPFNQSSYGFSVRHDVENTYIQADYYIGLDWLGDTGRYLYVEPKINSKTIEAFDEELQRDEPDKPVGKVTKNALGQTYELDYLKMLLDICAISESYKEVGDLVHVDWQKPPISVHQKDDYLTPFLVARFIKILQSIVRKGLKKSYYGVTRNLQNRVKGKILVGQQIKQNILKNRLTSTCCSFQEFNIDSTENRFLKKVLQFSSTYIENHKLLFYDNHKSLLETMRYCLPAFELVRNDISLHELKGIKHNAFYKEYKAAIQIGQFILKRFAYKISNAAETPTETPPFWIDMPRLFELYVYAQMVKANPEQKAHLHYQFSTYGNVLDILVSVPDYRMVIDAKYKLRYENGHVHSDIRQVAGYARLKKVRNKLGLGSDDRNVDCLIIYPDMNGIDDFSLATIYEAKKDIAAYHKVWKLGVKLPMIGERSGVAPAIISK